MSNWRDLQLAQHEHDVKCHWDILCLPADDRVNHMVLHFAKYVGRLARSDDSRSLVSTLVDTFIIALAAANALGVSLQSRFSSLDERIPPEVTSVGAAESVHTWFLRSLAVQTGRMAKAREAIDHIEAFDCRKELEGGIVSIFALCIEAAKRLGVDVVQLTQERWSELENKSRALGISYQRETAV